MLLDFIISAYASLSVKIHIILFTTANKTVSLTSFQLIRTRSCDGYPYLSSISGHSLDAASPRSFDDHIVSLFSTVSLAKLEKLSDFPYFETMVESSVYFRDFRENRSTTLSAYIRGDGDLSFRRKNATQFEDPLARPNDGIAKRRLPIRNRRDAFRNEIMFGNNSRQMKRSVRQLVRYYHSNAISNGLWMKRVI